MNFNKRSLAARASLYMLLFYFLSFLIYYIPSFVYSTDAIMYVSIFVRKAAYLLLPLTASAIAFTVMGFLGRRAALITLIPLTLARLIYILPSFYLIWLAEGYDSAESLLIGLGLSLGEALIVYGICAGVMFLMLLLFKLRGGKAANIKAALCEFDMFNLSNGVTFSFFAASFISFIYFFIDEVVNTVIFFIESGGSYRVGEIIYISVSFIYDLALFLIFHITLMLVKRAIILRHFTK